MVRCPNCGEENPERFRHCGYCGAQLSRPGGIEAAEEVRKTVTVVFCDLKDSTGLGEKLDSESLREVLDVYFSAMMASPMYFSTVPPCRSSTCLMAEK